MSQRRPGVFRRLRSLMRGMLGQWIRDREEENPEAVYEEAIAERTRQYRELKEAVAGILYMRNKLEGEIADRRAEIARLHDDVRRAVRRGEDELSLSLIAHKQALFEDLERAEQELEGVRSEAAEAKRNLVRFREEIRQLVREKGRVLASFANARARERLRSALDGLSMEAEMRALDGVRERVARMGSEEELDRELGDGGLRTRLRGLREEARRDAARAELARMKDELANHVIDVRAGQPAPAAG